MGITTVQAGHLESAQGQDGGWRGRLQGKPMVHLGTEPLPPDTGTGEQMAASPPVPSYPRDQGMASEPFPLFLLTKRHLLGRSQWQMGVMDPVTLSQPQSQGAFFLSGHQPRPAVNTKVGKLFSRPPALRWEGGQPTGVLCGRGWLWDRPLVGCE